MSQPAAQLSVLSETLSAQAIAFLRAGYERSRYLGMSGENMARVCPSFTPWIAAFTETLYAPKPLTPRDQELALLCLLGVRAPGMGLANHVYGALMEGMTVDEIVHVLALIGGYHGMEMLARCLLIVNRTLLVLNRLAQAKTNDCRAVVSAIVEDFGNTVI